MVLSKTVIRNQIFVVFSKELLLNITLKFRNDIYILLCVYLFIYYFYI